MATVRKLCCACRSSFGSARFQSQIWDDAIPEADQGWQFQARTEEILLPEYQPLMTLITPVAWRLRYGEGDHDYGSSQHHKKVFESSKHTNCFLLGANRKNETNAKYITDRTEVSVRRVLLPRADAQSLERAARQEIQLVARHQPRLFRR